MVRLLWSALLVLAPHPADHEALGAAGLIQRVRASGVLHHLVHYGQPARR